MESPNCTLFPNKHKSIYLSYKLLKNRGVHLCTAKVRHIIHVVVGLHITPFHQGNLNVERKTKPPSIIGTEKQAYFGISK